MLGHLQAQCPIEEFRELQRLAQFQSAKAFLGDTKPGRLNVPAVQA
jgi:hypothetical protein